jgi:hypothetical protein
MAEQQYQVYPNDVGSIIPVEPTLRESMRNILAESMGGDRIDYRKAEDLLTLGDFLPITGGGLMSADIADEYEKGNYGTAGMLATLGAIPVVGPAIAKGGRGLLTSAGNLLNRTALNTPTKIEDFYSVPLPLQVAKFGRAYTESVPSAVAESVSPQARANLRVLGISDTKIADVLSPDGKHAEYTAISMSRQLPNTENTLIEKSPISLSYLDSRIPREDPLKIKESIGDKFRASGSIPESVVNRATRHLIDGPHVNNPKAVYEYQIKDPSAVNNLGYVESVAASKTGPPVIRALRGQATDSYLKTLNTLRKRTKASTQEKLSSVDMVEFLQISSSLDSRAIRSLREEGITGQDSNIVEKLLSARAKKANGIPFTSKDQQQELLFNKFNDLVKKGKIKLAKVSDDAGNSVGSLNVEDIKSPEGYLFTQQSFTSRQQELGGMNAFVSIDPKTQKIYTMLSDGHDIFGQAPIGGKHLITTFPIIESSYKTGSKWNNKQLKTRNTKRNTNKAIKEVEKTTGVSIKKGESPNNYTKRALAEAQIKPTDLDIRAANASVNKLKILTGATGAGIGLAGAGMLTREE